jgi:hypothetical protein
MNELIMCLTPQGLALTKQIQLNLYLRPKTRECFVIHFSIFPMINVFSKEIYGRSGHAG